MRHPPTKALATVLAALALAALAAGSPRAASPAFRVIVHPANASTVLDRKFLTEVFLKRSTRWSTGELVRPVDQGTDSPVRRRFSEDVMNRSVAAVKSYWQQMIFSGRAIPPPELDSDEEVIRFVAKYPGAVGYVGYTAELTGVKVVALK
jgi:ABC-type phosphate transport system substrate-binding protein